MDRISQVCMDPPLNKIEIYSDNLEKQKLINFENNNDHLFSIVKNYKLQEFLEKNLSLKRVFLNKLFISFSNKLV